MSDSFKKELLFDLGLLLLIAAVFLGGFAYFRLEFGRFAEKRSALSAKMDAHGPWAEQGVWAADDGSAVYAHGVLLHPRRMARLCGGLRPVL